jgi:hypothetical protein
MRGPNNEALACSDCRAVFGREGSVDIGAAAMTLSVTESGATRGDPGRTTVDLGFKSKTGEVDVEPLTVSAITDVAECARRLAQGGARIREFQDQVRVEVLACTGVSCALGEARLHKTILRTGGTVINGSGPAART